jgi:omega-amidase
VKIAVAQIACKPGDVPANLRTLGEYAERAHRAGAELVVFPEMADTGYTMQVIREHATSWNEGAVPELQRIARTFSIAIVSGVSEREKGLIYNSQVAIDSNGAILAKYRKTHLFAPIGEDRCCAPGHDLVSLALGPFQFGLTICYDLRFPEVYRALAIDLGTNAFIISSAWPFPRAEHLRTLALARAIENQSYVILANRIGRDDGAPFCGLSAVIDPAGIVVAATSPDRAELIVVDLSQEVLQTVRERMQVFSHRRPDLYEKVSGRSAD